ncbi:MAG: beta-propeller domain-containing protein [Deltaproteobacteria bacterium]|nr:beta-propeller domain-containing protein [Deltaproteobacteria bacterium]
MTYRRALALPLLALSFAAASGCGDDGDTSYSPEVVDRAVLVHFASCEDVLDYAQYRGLEQVGAYGFDGDQGWGWGEDAAGEGGDGAAPPSADGGASGDGGETGGGNDNSPDYSGTNVQELGVDEPDIVKTDGTRILALAQGQLHYVDVAADSPAVVSSLPILTADNEYYYYTGSEMLVRGDRVLVTVHRGAWDLPQNIRNNFGLGEEDYQSIVQLVEVDISNPSDMQVVSSLYVEGNYVSGRLHDDAARVVLSAGVHTLDFKYPWDFLDEEDDADYDEWSGWEETAYARAEQEARAYNRRAVLSSELSDWVPSYVFENHGPEGTTLERGQLVDCERMMRPGTHAGLGTLSVLTIDMDQPLALGDAVGLFSEGQTVYASPESLYVATRPFVLNDDPAAFGEDESLQLTSYIHKFDITRDDAAYYVASGEVPGYLLSQWAMSEHEGDLRVATTEWDWSSESESYVSVLREQGQRLELIGQVDGLGLGEQIYAVRFIGETGYVVTFRQIDPLYTIDLSTPTAPQMVGELKIEGYSAYLHPVGENLLLGVGRDGTAEGQVTGSQISLFDVSDPANPTVVHQASFGEWGSSEVEFDHRAFLWWGAENLAVFPVQSYGYDEETGEDLSFTGALAYRVDPEAGIQLVGSLEHEQVDQSGDGWFGNNIRRSIVIGDQLFTMSEGGLMRSNLGDMNTNAWLGF